MTIENFEEFKRKNKNISPNFLGSLKYISDELPPLRAYFHNSGLVEAFGAEKTVINAKKHLLESLIANSSLSADASYLIAAVWGEEGNKMIDLFKYSKLNGWPGNPTVSSFVIKNGVYAPERRDITCGDTLIMLGLEEQLRRRTVNVIQYMSYTQYNM